MLPILRTICVYVLIIWVFSLMTQREQMITLAGMQLFCTSVALYIYLYKWR